MSEKMSSIPDNLRYSKTHEWITAEPDKNGNYKIGITDYAQNIINDIVHIEYPVAADTAIEAAQATGIVIESVKSANDVYSPISGIITNFNNALEERAFDVNTAPYQEGWLATIKPNDLSEFTTLLMTAEEYKKFIQES